VRHYAGIMPKYEELILKQDNFKRLLKTEV
jgi:hypothetical protein